IVLSSEASSRPSIREPKTTRICLWVMVEPSATCGAEGLVMVSVRPAPRPPPPVMETLRVAAFLGMCVSVFRRGAVLLLVALGDDRAEVLDIAAHQPLQGPQVLRVPVAQALAHRRDALVPEVLHV